MERRLVLEGRHTRWCVGACSVPTCCPQGSLSVPASVPALRRFYVGVCDSYYPYCMHGIGGIGGIALVCLLQWSPSRCTPPWVQILWASLISGGGTDGVESHERGLQMESSPVKGVQMQSSTVKGVTNLVRPRSSPFYGTKNGTSLLS